MIEAFFPPLPLSLFVAINVMAFGFWQGYLVSWIGTCVGSIIVFLFIKRIRTSRFQKLLYSNKKFENIFIWIKEKGFIPIFLLLTFPFTPSIVVCGLAGLAGVKTREYLSGLLLGKLIMVFSLSFIGYNIKSFLVKPVKSLILIFFTLLISYVAKKIIYWYEQKMIKKCRKKVVQIKKVDNAAEVA
jgi:uncharacterized membrane protein YdjX (TVP38/TMEM64 family)